MKKGSKKAPAAPDLVAAASRRYVVRLTAAAQKQLDKLPNETAERIGAAVVKLAFDPRPPGVVKLTGQEGYRIRVGNYRVLYTIEDAVLLVEVVKVGQRGNFYDR